MIRRCHIEYWGSDKVSARFWTTGTSQPDECMICAAEYAASARVAGSSGRSSR
jgi:hypothetical protein